MEAITTIGSRKMDIMMNLAFSISLMAHSTIQTVFTSTQKALIKAAAITTRIAYINCLKKYQKRLKSNIQSTLIINKASYDHHDYYEEEVEEKYTEEYIKFVLEHKYYENLEHLKNTNQEIFYLKAGNLPETTSKKDILKYLGDKGIDTSQITVVMKNAGGSPVAQMEIYKRNPAINTLKCCGEYYGEKQMIIEVDEQNEQYYIGDTQDYYADEFEDPHQDRYAKFDDYEIPPPVKQNESKQKKVEKTESEVKQS